MKENMVLIGAGSAMFTRGLVADVIRQGWEGELRMVDIDADALAVAEGLTRKMLEAGGSALRLDCSADRRDVLPGATCVICTVGVGGRRAWEQDVVIPRKYGIFQPVGDSVMPGGTSRALRMIPAMVDIACDVMELAPDALFFNYGNPMACVCRAVRKAAGASVVGLCHGVFGVAAHIAKELGVEPADMEYSAVGMNHLTWFTDVRCAGRDMLPRLRELAAEKLGRPIDANGLGARFAESGTAERGTVPEDLANPFTWELVHLFGAFPAVLDRHVTEFFAHMFCREGAYYGKTMGVEGCYSVEATIAHGDRIFAEMKQQALSCDPLPSDYFERTSGEHEQVTEIIESIRSDAGRTYSANVPNTGQVPNLPADAVIECPCTAAGEGVQPIPQPALAPGLAGTLATRFQWVETVVEAALEGSREKFVQALLLDGAVESIGTARVLADELIEAQKQYLPQFA